MTDPITITTTHDTPLFDPEDHRAAAAQQIGVDAGDIHCIDCGPDTWEEIKPNVFSQDGTVLQHRVVHYHRKTTWAERPRASELEMVAAEPEPEIHPWPTLNLHRGSKWHGPVTIDGVTAEHTFISTGSELVLLESPNGRAVQKALEDENQAATGG